MRDYSKVNGQFWTGKTGKALRGDAQAQIVAMYLVTSPHSNMIGVYHCPILYVAHETGLPIEGASKGLQRLIEGEYCTYDEASETVFVHEMAKYQIGESLSPNDKQVKGVQKQFDVIRHLQDALAAGVSVDAMQLEAKNTRNWTEFRNWLYDVMGDANV